MTESEAVQIACDWVQVRMEVRKHLITRTRRCDLGWAGNNSPRDNEIRKLHNYPGDLSEQRLLRLADTCPAPPAS